uniref:Cytochrome b561 domain-containing protein n=1 Tax=Macrostomum lignano TaxID=282301 RepID=A0A1I8F7Q2_9PLAT
LQVTKVSKMLQYKRLELEKPHLRHGRQCHRLSANTYLSTTPSVWPGVPAGTRVYMSCPATMSTSSTGGASPGGVALAMAAGTRPAGKPGRGEGWTNFTRLLSERTRPALHWVIHSIGHIGYGISLVFLLLAIAASWPVSGCHLPLSSDPATYSVIASYHLVFVEALHLGALLPLHRHLGGAAAPLEIGQCCAQSTCDGRCTSGCVNVYLCLLVALNAGLSSLEIVRERFVKIEEQPLERAANAESIGERPASAFAT